jgi:hypothetical protein
MFWDLFADRQVITDEMNKISKEVLRYEYASAHDIIT